MFWSSLLLHSCGALYAGGAGTIMKPVRPARTAVQDGKSKLLPNINPPAK